MSRRTPHGDGTWADGGARGGRAPMRVPIREEEDVAVARLRVRELTDAEAFSPGRAGALATAVTEVAWNILDHAGQGEIVLVLVTEGGRRGVAVVARDEEPGIRDVEAALADGYSTGRGLGFGLPGARRLVDEFALASAVGEGTTVMMKKWAHDAS